MVTPIYAALLTFILIYLIFSVIKLRKQHQVSLGDGGFEDLQRAIRAHGNFVETALWGIFMIFLIEYQDGDHAAIHGLGLLLVIGRILHIQALRTGIINVRIAAVVSTLIVFGISALYNLYLAFAVGV